MASFNHTFLLDLAAAAHRDETILDYGCGRGEAVAAGLRRGQDIWGVDTFGGVWADWRMNIDAGAAGRVQAIASGAAPFADGSFGAIMANQVLEHVERPDAVLADIHRMLRPGGTFYATLPVLETWYEPHIGLYFPHRLSGRAQSGYLALMHALRMGLNRAQAPTRGAWVRGAQANMRQDIFYHREAALKRMLEARFGSPVRDLSLDFMRGKLGRRAAMLPPVADPLLRFVCRARGGLFLAVAKA